jgi:hypothetical protein
LGNVALWPATVQGIKLANDIFFNAFHDKWRAPDYVCVSKNIVESHHGNSLTVEVIDQRTFDKSKTHDSTLVLEDSTVPDPQMEGHESLLFTFGGREESVKDKFITFTKFVSHETPREYRKRDARIDDAFQKRLADLRIT